MTVYPSPDHEPTDELRGLRVLHATDSFLPNVGGMELAIAELVRSQVSRDRMVVIATPEHPNAPEHEDMDGAEVERLPMAMAHIPGVYADPVHRFFPPIPDPIFSRSFASMVRRFQPDIIHAHGWILYSVIGVARRHGIPVVATAHDYGHVCAKKTMLYRDGELCSGPGLLKCTSCAHDHYGAKGIPLAAGLHEFGSRSNRDVAQWMAISEAVAAKGSAPRPHDRAQMNVIPEFIGDDIIDLARDERTARRPEFVPAAGPYLFYAGALGTHKGVDVLLAAHAKLLSRGFDVPLVLAGLPRPDFTIDDRPSVTVVNSVPLPAVIAAWRHAAIGVVPSVWPEPFGRVAVECLAGGTPCVTSAIGGLAEVVTDGVDGIHVRPGDAEALAAALQRLIDDEPLRSRLGAAGPAKAATFKLARVLPLVDEVYSRVMMNAGYRRGDSQRRTGDFYRATSAKARKLR